MRFLKSIFNKIRNFFRLIVFLILLPFIIAGGFAAGMYFELLDSNQIKQVNETLSLYKWPLVGNYFEVPEGVEWTKEDTDKATDEFMTTISTGIDSGISKVTEVAENIMKPEEPPKKEIKISQKEIDAKMQEREKAEKKRISKLARVYMSMKADAAAEALGNLDADMAVLILQKMEDDSAAQILAKMDPVIAARLTQMMFNGVNHQVAVPSEIRQELLQERREQAELEGEETAVDAAYVDEYVEGEYVEPEYVEPEYVEGEYVEEEYVEEGAEPEYVEEEPVEPEY